MSAKKRPRYFRNPKTTHERRFSFSHMEFVNIRSKRNHLNIPDSYDDLHLTKWWVKSWKDLYKKRKQWEKKNPFRIMHYKLRNLNAFN